MLSAKPIAIAPMLPSLNDVNATSVKINVPTSSAKITLIIFFGSVVVFSRLATVTTGSVFTAGAFFLGALVLTVRTVVLLALAAAGFLAVAFLVEAAFLVAMYIPPLLKYMISIPYALICAL